MELGKYTGKRFAYEWDCCWLGWSLAQLNPTLLEQKGLLQRATDNVASFVFEGCMSRTKLKSHRNEKHKARDARLPLHEWERFMVPRPDWLPGLDQDKQQKERLKKLYDTTKELYERNIPRGLGKDPKTLEAATRLAIGFYAQHVNGESFTSTGEKKVSSEMEKKIDLPSVMNYINIPADPHADESQQIRVNVLLDKVRDNVISDSVRQEGMVFIDVFDTDGIADADLKKKVLYKKSILQHYRNKPIGLLGPDRENLPPLPDLISACGLDIDEYNFHWRTFQLEMNNLGFKIVHS